MHSSALTPSRSSSRTSGGIFEDTGLEKELSDIDRQMQEPGFWDDPTRNASLMQQRRGLERRLDTLKRLRSDAEELTTWRELLDEGETDEELARFLDRLKTDLD